MALRKGVRVIPLREKEHLYIHAILKQKLDASQRGLYARRIAVINQSDVRSEPFYQTHLLYGKRGTRRSHHIAHPCLVHGDDIHIALHKYALLSLGYSLLGLIEPVELSALEVDVRFGRVDIFGYLLLLAESTASESDHLA